MALCKDEVLTNNPVPKFLLIETGTDICSVGLAQGAELVALRESAEEKSHARQTAVYVDELLKEIGWEANQLSAVVLGKGPGSYTGLRIGTSLAKGLCFGLNIPLIAVDSLLALTTQAIQLYNAQDNTTLFCPMIDARRMEVYTALYTYKSEVVEPTSAQIIDEQSFSAVLAKKNIVFFGNGSEKCKVVLTHPNAAFMQVSPSVKGMLAPAMQAYTTQQFEDVAYFEPFYLKDFVVTKSNKKIL